MHRDDIEPIEQIPPVNPELLRVLKEQFPIRLPSPGSTEREDMFYSGQQEVISYLELAYDDQLERAREQRV